MGGASIPRIGGGAVVLAGGSLWIAAVADTDQANMFSVLSNFMVIKLVG